MRSLRCANKSMNIIAQVAPLRSRPPAQEQVGGYHRAPGHNLRCLPKSPGSVLMEIRHGHRAETDIGDWRTIQTRFCHRWRLKSISTDVTRFPRSSSWASLIPVLLHDTGAGACPTQKLNAKELSILRSASEKGGNEELLLIWDY